LNSAVYSCFGMCFTSFFLSLRRSYDDYVGRRNSWGSSLGAFYRKLCARMDKPRANTATAHKLARLVYFMLTRGEAFVDEGQQRYEEQQRERSIAALKRRAATLGFQINPIGAAAA
ncbi:hypothetical protein MX653_15755, partial [Thauera aromatica]|nr:hypothetical protein [Thauera aromatica]